MNSSKPDSDIRLAIRSISAVLPLYKKGFDSAPWVPGEMKRVISIAVALAAAILPRSGREALRNEKIKRRGRKIAGIEFVFEA